MSTNERQNDRLKELCIQTWLLLTKDERETFIEEGPIGFVETFAYLLGLDVTDENREVWLDIGDTLLIISKLKFPEVK